MKFSFLCWNIEHFRGTDERADRVGRFIRQNFNPDVFCLLEFQGKSAVRRLISRHFDRYDFGMTDSKMGIELLIGWRRKKFDQIIFTQRREFQAGDINLRPGGLLSLKLHGERPFYNMLFLHTDSGTKPKDYRNRLKMYRKIWKLKAALATVPAQNGDARLLAMGDLNTMGRKTPRVLADQERAKLNRDAAKAGMTVQTKSAQATWRGRVDGRMTESDLDHVIASDDLRLQQFYYPGSTDPDFAIKVGGWNWKQGTDRTDWLKNMSDHCAVYGEVI